MVTDALVDLRATAGHGGDDLVSKDNKESAKCDKGKSLKLGEKEKKKRVFPWAKQNKFNGGDGRQRQWCFFCRGSH